MFVTPLVFQPERLTEMRDEQPLNMRPMFPTVDTSRPDASTVVKLEKLLNISCVSPMTVALVKVTDLILDLLMVLTTLSHWDLLRLPLLTVSAPVLLSNVYDAFPIMPEEESWACAITGSSDATPVASLPTTFSLVSPRITVREFLDIVHDFQGTVVLGSAEVLGRLR